VGKDGFVVPKDFGEFFERDPLRVRRWVTKRLHRRCGQDTILDVDQDLLLYPCTLSPDSRFRRKGANGRPDGCTDVIQCFDPVRHYGATAGRFHNFHQSLPRKPAEHDPGEAAVQSCLRSSKPEYLSGSVAAGRIDEAFLLKHSGTFAAESRRGCTKHNPF
jgi:hypothetical protein